MRRASLVLLLALAAGACGKDTEPMGPTPGAFDIVLTGNGAAPAAILFVVDGGTVDTVEAAGFYTRSAPFSGVAVQVLVAGSGVHGVLARIRVPDTRVKYRATVREAGAAGTHSLLPIDDYPLKVLRVNE